MNNEDLKHSIFHKDSILANACDRFSFRMDFYSKPQFYEIFIDLWNSYLKEFGLKNTSYSFQPLNRFQQNIVNVDSIAESLNTSLEQITVEPTYIYRDLNALICQEKPSNGEITLFINRYYINLHISEFRIDDRTSKFLNWLYDTLIKLWNENTISIADMQIMTSASEILSIESYKCNDGFGGYKAIDSDFIHNQWSSTQFVYSDLNCTVTNILRLSNVRFEDESPEKMWEHTILAICVHRFDEGNGNESFNSLFNRMLEQSQESIKLCAK